MVLSTWKFISNSGWWPLIIRLQTQIQQPLRDWAVTCPPSWALMTGCVLFWNSSTTPMTCSSEVSQMCQTSEMFVVCNFCNCCNFCKFCKFCKTCSLKFLTSVTSVLVIRFRDFRIFLYNFILNFRILPLNFSLGSCRCALKRSPAKIAWNKSLGEISFAENLKFQKMQIAGQFWEMPRVAFVPGRSCVIPVLGVRHLLSATHLCCYTRPLFVDLYLRPPIRFRLFPSPGKQSFPAKQSLSFSEVSFKRVRSKKNARSLETFCCYLSSTSDLESIAHARSVF